MSSSLRALARLARRDIARHRLRSLLVTVLVLLPVAAMVAGIAIYRTTLGTQERDDVARMGRADLIASGTTREELLRRLPPGSVLESITSTDGRIVVPGARPGVVLRAMDIEGLAAGMVTLIEGARPMGADQVAISPATAKLAGVGIGGRIEVDGVTSATVVGIVENPLFLGDRIVVVDPKAVQLADESFATWLVGLPPGIDPESVVQANTDPETGAQQVLIQSRRSGGVTVIGGDGGNSSILILGSLALVEAALIASAAFAVSIRRRQRELGLLAATGATPRQLASSVVIEAAILGLIACMLGVGVGLAGAFAMTPFLDELTQRRNPPLTVDIGGLVAPALIGFVAAMIAAIVPARTVARLPVLLALSGRRPPHVPARRTLAMGAAMIILAGLMTVAGATMRGAGSDTGSIGLLVAGAVLSTLGFGACGPWLLERLERVAVSLPLAGRIALRDTARGRSRSSPIVTAILASCAAAIALGAWQVSRDEENLHGWRPSLYPDQLVVRGPGAAAAGELLRGEDGAVDGTSIPYLGYDDPNVFVAYQLPDARDQDGNLINLLDQCENCNPGAFEPYGVYRAAPATPAIVATREVESIQPDLAAGRAVVFSWRAATATKLEVIVHRDPENPEVTERLTLPVRLIHVDVPGGTLPDLFLPDAAIRQLGLVEFDGSPQFEPEPYVVRYDHPVTGADLAHAQEVASRYLDTIAIVDTPPVRPGAEFRLVVIALVLLFAVSVTGIAIALGEAESRPEQRSLLAVGADPRLRRRIAASRAAVLASLAGVLAVPAGLLPIWGIFVSRGSAFAVPILEIGGALIALPVLAVLGTWLLSRPIPDWSAFRGEGRG